MFKVDESEVLKRNPKADAGKLAEARAAKKSVEKTRPAGKGREGYNLVPPFGQSVRYPMKSDVCES
jgi:ribosomal 50S subunit-associated protein YjgA (DUF615 family)